MAISKEDILEGIGNMSVLDLSELIKEMEEKFGVSAAAAAVAAPAASGDGAAAAADDKSEFDLHLTGVGDNKVNVIKAVREITGLGLKEAKDIVDAVFKVVKETLDKASAEEALKKLTEAGVIGELK